MALGELIGIIIFGPILMLMDYFAFIKRLDPYDAELTKASHGAFMICACLSYLHWRGGGTLPTDLALYETISMLCVGVLGGFWFIIGASRTRWYHFDGRHAGRAAAKIVFGGTLYHFREWRDLNDYQPWVWFAFTIVGLWCIITGITKLILVLRGPSEPTMSGPDDPYGGSDFTGGGNLR
jgi:hypothetical protein